MSLIDVLSRVLITSLVHSCFAWIGCILVGYMTQRGPLLFIPMVALAYAVLAVVFTGWGLKWEFRRRPELSVDAYSFALSRLLVGWIAFLATRLIPVPSP